MKKTLLLLSLSAVPVLSARAQIAPIPPVAPPVAPPAAKPPVAAPPPLLDEATRLLEATLAYNAGLAAIKKSDWNSAETSFDRATALSPNDAGAWSFLGYVRLQQKSWDGALTALQAAQDNGQALDVTARAQLLNNIGFARWNKDQSPSALNSFGEALGLNPDYYDARYNLAFALLASEKYADALPHLKLLAAKNSNDPAIQEGLGQAFDATGSSGAALGAYKNAIALAPKK